MITVEKLKERYPEVAEETLAEKLAMVNQQEILDEALSILSLQIWDKKTAINGVAAKTILSDNSYKGVNAVYLINKEGRTIIIQPFNPTVAGNVTMTTAEAEAIGESERQKMATTLTDEKVIDIIGSLLGGSDG